jgi:radical SAM superfamily enzyme YgiQ (UPF0313 family)
MNEYLGSPSLGIASVAAMTPDDWELEMRDDRLAPADYETDADLVALSFFTPAATRALALADWFRAQGKTVVAGGIFPTAMPDIVQPHVDAVVVGEGEAVWPRLLDDFRAGCLLPRYSAAPCDLAGLPLPRVDLYFTQEGAAFRPDDYPLQISRGCPLACRACILPTSMGGACRTHRLEHVLGQLANLSKAGKRACLTEDTSWLPGAPRELLKTFLQTLVERGERASVSYVGTSMTMIRSTPASMLALAKEAGVDMFYLVTGFDPITMRAWTGQDDRAYTRAIEAVAKSWDAGIEPYASFLYGSDYDDEGTVDRILEFCHTAKIRKCEFAVATPYPGTPDWYRIEAEGRLLTREWRHYNDTTCVYRPAQLTPEQVEAGYLRLWRDFYANRGDLTTLSVYDRTIQF